MPHTRGSVIRLVLFALAPLFVACGGLEPERGDVSRIDVSAEWGMSLGVGDTLVVGAVLRDANGNAVRKAGHTVWWSVSPASIAKITSSGVLVGLAAGEGTVEARVGTAVGTATFSVLPVFPRIASVFLYGPSVLYVGDTSRAVVHLRDADSVAVDPATRTIRWSIAPNNVARVDSTGKITALGIGSAKLTVQVNEIQRSLTFSVESTPSPPPPRDTLLLSWPYTLYLHTAPHMLPGDTVLASIGVYAPPVGLHWYDTLAAYSASPPSVATITGVRGVAARTSGVAVISATCRGLSHSRQVQVLAPPSSWAEFLSVSIDFYGYQTCGVLKSDGSLLCWGGGNPSGSPDGTPRQPMRPIAGSAGFIWNAGASCGLLADRTLRCVSSTSTSPPSSTTTAKWLKFAVREYNYNRTTCGLLIDSTAACWYGGDSIVPQASGTRFLDLGVGRELCGIRTDSTAVCWARGSATLTPVPGLTRLVQVASGSSHQCYVNADRLLFCVGDNAASQLGDGTTLQREAPSQPMGGVAVTGVFAEGVVQTCALDSDGAAWCWGGSRKSPTLVPTSAGFTSINFGPYHTCGLKGDGSAWCWGSNMWGQLGDGTAISRTRPTRVRGSYPP